ncbi:LOW QUALITY PROTEIN: uncharacterized protein [Diadema setosum]|uniref:LOW QUALITY PROTEIN: uncharacterized protein n=1 Tax=Diadema setosum TaxID=31175 RepID=UPI003B3A4DC6
MPSIPRLRRVPNPSYPKWETPNVMLVDGPSPLEGLVVFETDRYVCYDGFNDEAAELPTAADCSSHEAVRLKCREPYGETESEVKNSQKWICPRQTEDEFGRLVHDSFNIPMAFCVYPGHVPNGHWDSNVTSFGSKVTLICDEGYIVNGSATLQCVGLPGRSTYFPTWNVSIPFCFKSETVTKGATSITPTRTQNADYISSEGLLTYELTTLPEITATSFLSDGKPTENVIILDTSETTTTSEVPEDNDDIFAMAALLCVVPILVAVLFMVLCRHHKKRRRSSQISNQTTTQLQMDPVDNANQNLSATDHAALESTFTDAVAEGHPSQNHHGNIFRDVTTHQENLYHVYQDAGEVDKGSSQPSNLPVSLCTVSLQSNVTSSENASVSIPCVYENHGVQETSLDQTASCHEDCEYQDVDLCGNDWLTKKGSRSFDGAHLFDERCYNSLNFGKQSAQNIPSNGESEYDHCNRPLLDKRLQSTQADLSASGPSSHGEVHSDRNDDISYPCVGSLPTVNRDDVFYYQLHPGEANSIETFNKPQFTDAFDSGEYCLLNPDKGSTHDKHPTKRDDNLSDYYDSESPMSYVANTKHCEELYATVNKTVGTSLAAKPATLEELYATVNKTVGANSAAKPATCEELYATVNKTLAANSAGKPATCEELYAKVDKTKDGQIGNKATSQEELYMNVTNTNVDL